MKLQEGEVHLFQVLKAVSIAGEGDFFQLRHPSGRRLLLSASRYNNHGIKPGSNIECKIDKVTCTGKVFLEPKHPVYSEGNTYPFDVIEVTKDKKHSGMLLLRVKDLFCNEIEVLCKENILINSNRIDLKVEFIHKGIPSLACTNN